jgi:hypothetical protein
LSARHPRMVVARPLGSLSGCASSSSGMGLYDHGGVGGEGRHVVVRRRRGGGGAFAPFACPVARLLRASLLVVGGRRCRRIPATGDSIRAGLAWWWPDPVVMARGWPTIGPPHPPVLPGRCWVGAGRCWPATAVWQLPVSGVGVLGGGGAALRRRRGGVADSSFGRSVVPRRRCRLCRTCWWLLLYGGSVGRASWGGCPFGCGDGDGAPSPLLAFRLLLMVAVSRRWLGVCWRWGAVFVYAVPPPCLLRPAWGCRHEDRGLGAHGGAGPGLCSRFGTFRGWRVKGRDGGLEGG